MSTEPVSEISMAGEEEDEELALAKQIEMEKEQEAKSEETLKELRGASNRLLRSVERENAALRGPQPPKMSVEAKVKSQARKTMLLEKMRARRNGTKISSKLSGPKHDPKMVTDLNVKVSE